MQQSLSLTEWLAKCPDPIIANIIQDPAELRYLISSATIYPAGTLITLPLMSLKEFFDKDKSEKTLKNLDTTTNPC